MYKITNKFLVIAFLVVAALTFSNLLFAGPVDSWPSKPRHYVTDDAGMISSGIEQGLNGYLQELEQKTGIQFLVVTVDTLGDETKETLALAISEHWKIGQKGKDNGMLLLLARQERVYRFETGYGLEGVLPDSFLGSVGRNRMVPLFKEGKYSEGIMLGAITVIGEIAQNYQVEITGMPKLKKMRRSGGFSLGSIFLIFFVISNIFGGIVGRRRSSLGRWRGGSRNLPFYLLLFGGFGGRSSGSGFGGGGFGSFGGGGGGGFGGGGAGGSW